MLVYYKDINVGEFSMKKLLISLVMLVPFVSGCTDIETRVNINPDKTASVVASVTYQGDLTNKDDVAGQAIAANYPKLLDKMYLVEKVYSPKLSTITASKKITNIYHEDLDLESLGFKSNLPSGKYIEVKKNFLVKSYNVDLVFDYPSVKKRLDIPAVDLSSDKAQQKQGIDPEYYNRYIAQQPKTEKVSNSEFDMESNLDDSAKQLLEKSKSDKADSKKPAKTADSTTFSIQLPSYASYNNADSVVDNVYSWNIKKDAPTVIKLQYVQYSDWALAFVILLGILLLIYVARRIIRRDTTKRIDNIENIV